MKALRAALAALAGLVLAIAPAHAQAPGGTTTVIVVRHAEKAAEPAADPALTTAGVARAEALVDVVANAGVRAVMSTGFARTRMTAAPTAARFGLVTEIVDAGAPGHPAALAASLLAKHRGETVLVVGHSNTVPAIVEALGAPRPAPICDAEYDNLFVVAIPPSGPPVLIRTKYGAASPVDDSCRAIK